MFTYSPLRYPGGKAQLAKYMASIVEQNGLLNGTYAEPYAGGAGVAIYLLLHKYVNQIYINDIDYSIYAFWYSLKHNTDELCALIQDTEISIDNWLLQKEVQKNLNNYTLLQVGFSTFFLNRTNRSGILKGGVIGGVNQIGAYKLNCRFNKEGLIKRIRRIVEYKEYIHISNKDAIDFLEENYDIFDRNTLIYLDPPYYNKGQQLYTNFYTHDDHVQLQNYIANTNKKWIITYDNTEAINAIYSGANKIDLDINYSAAEKRIGSEILFYSPGLVI